MRWTVVYRPAAENELIDLWVAAPDQADVTRAANLIERKLRRDPYSLHSEFAAIAVEDLRQTVTDDQEVVPRGCIHDLGLVGVPFLKSQHGTAHHEFRDVSGSGPALEDRQVPGERVLGLPREPDPWQGHPWREVPRS